MFNKKDLKEYLVFSSSSILNILKLSSRIYILPSVIIYPSNACNYDCIMCTNARSKIKNHDIMDFHLMKKTIIECSKFVFKPRVHFSGLGEPLIYQKIKDAMRLCKEKGLKWGMTTNGYLLEKYAKDIVLNNCDAINVSIHGGLLEHNKITGTKGAFEKVVEGIKKVDDTKKRFGRNRPLIAINCVFNNDNIDTLIGIPNTFIKLPVNSITFQHLIFLKEDLEKNKTFLIRDNEKLGKLMKFVDFIEKGRFPIKMNLLPSIKKNDITGYYTNKDYKFSHSCIIPWLSARIYPNGNVSSCFQVFGNVKDNPLKWIINNKKALKFRDLIRKGKFKIPFCFRCCHRIYY